MTRRKSTVRPGACRMVKVDLGQTAKGVAIGLRVASDAVKRAIDDGNIKPTVDPTERERRKAAVKRTRASEARKIADGGMRLPGVVLDAQHADMLRTLVELDGSIAQAIREAISARWLAMRIGGRIRRREPTS